MASGLLQYHDALALLPNDALPLTRMEMIPLREAIGRVVAQDITAPSALPRFAASAMDGYALRAEWTVRADKLTPVRLDVVGEVFAGDAPPVGASARGVLQISTGAPLPEGYDSVIRKEDVELSDDKTAILLRMPVQRGNDVRMPGEDFDLGQSVISRGRRIGARELMSLAALGVAELSVFCRPRVSIVTTGNEIARVGQALGKGRIYDSNGPALFAAFTAMGCEVTLVDCVGDDRALLTAAIAKLDADLIISVGAVSEGVRDLIPEVAHALGAKTLFHKTAIRPGKPLFAGKLPGSLWLGLPGNPVSALVGLRFFASAFVRRLCDQPAEQPFMLPLAKAIATKAPFLHFFRARYDPSSGGVECLNDQASHLTRSVLNANVWVLCDGGRSYAAGDSVKTYPLFDALDDLAKEMR